VPVLIEVRPARHIAKMKERRMANAPVLRVGEKFILE